MAWITLMDLGSYRIVKDAAGEKNALFRYWAVGARCDHCQLLCSEDQQQKETT